MHLVGDQVGGWANRVVNKLNDQLLDGNDYYGTTPQKKSILQLFNSITDIVCN